MGQQLQQQRMLRSLRSSLPCDGGCALIAAHVVVQVQAAQAARVAHQLVHRGAAVHGAAHVLEGNGLQRGLRRGAERAGEGVGRAQGKQRMLAKDNRLHRSAGPKWQAMASMARGQLGGK